MREIKFEFKALVNKDNYVDTWIDYGDMNRNIEKEISRHYFEFVDKTILENMPTNMLNDLKQKITDELCKRVSSGWVSTSC